MEWLLIALMPYLKACMKAAPLVSIEIQYGELLDENDIVRISDNYNWM